MQSDHQCLRQVKCNGDSRRCGCYVSRQAELLHRSRNVQKPWMVSKWQALHDAQPLLRAQFMTEKFQASRQAELLHCSCDVQKPCMVSKWQALHDA